MTPEQAYQTVRQFNSIHQEFSIVMTAHLQRKMIQAMNAPTHFNHPEYTEFMGHKLHIATSRDDLIDTLAQCTDNNELILFLS